MKITKALSRIIAIPLLLIIRGYQLFISPFLGQNCRFYPTCSCYAHEALQQHGALKGSILSIKRIVKCQPMHAGGIDLVPKVTSDRIKAKKSDKNSHDLRLKKIATNTLNTKL